MTCQQQHDPDADGGVGDVEVGPHVRAPVHVDEIGDVTQPHAVDEVADGASGDEGEGEAGQRGAVGQAVPVREDEEEDGGAEDGEHDRLPGQPASGQHAEGHAAVAAVDEADQTGDDLVVVVEAEAAAHERLAELVEDDDGHRAGGLDDPGPAWRRRQAPIVVAARDRGGRKRISRVGSG